MGFRVLYKLCVVCLLGAMAGCAHAPTPQSHTKPPTHYPIHGPLTATVAGTPARLKAELPQKLDFSVRTLDPLVTRPTPPTLRYARPLQYLFVGRDHPAPLAFIIAGTGDSALSGNCVLLSRALYQAGYSVACLPSPTSVTFMLGAAEHPVPGRMPTDIRALYNLMEEVRDDLAEEIDITGYALTGWSLGATQAAFLARYDQRQQLFRFRHVLLINPTVDLWRSVERMDTLLQDTLSGGYEALPGFLAKILGDIQDIQNSDQPLRFNEDVLYQAYDSRAFNHQQIGALVGLAFRLSLANMAYAADVITQSDVIVPDNIQPGPYESLGIYFKRSFAMSFTDYLNDLLVPYWHRNDRHVGKAEIIREASLRSIRGFLARNTRIAVFTNDNDPILNADEVAFLRNTFGERARIRPYGGHLGNLAYRKTIQALQAFFADE